MAFLPEHGAVWPMFGLIFVIGVLHQLITPIQWVMMSDTVDYGEWKQGRRLTGVSFAGTLFVLKLGLALSGAVIGWTLAFSHYASGAPTQTSATTKAIIALFTVFPAMCYAASALVARFYRLRRDQVRQIAVALSGADAVTSPP